MNILDNGWLPVGLKNLKPSSKHVSQEMPRCCLSEMFRNVVLGLRLSIPDFNQEEGYDQKIWNLEKLAWVILGITAAGSATCFGDWSSQHCNKCCHIVRCDTSSSSIVTTLPSKASSVRTMLPSLDNNQNTCPGCGTHLLIKQAATGTRTGQHYINVTLRAKKRLPGVKIVW